MAEAKLKGVLSLLKIEGIDGGSVHKKDYIDIASFSFPMAVQNNTTGGARSGVGGHVMYGPFTFYKRLDKATPLLFKALSEREQVKGAKFELYRDAAKGGDSELYFTVEFKQIYITVSRLFQNASESSPIQLEEISIVAQGISYSHDKASKSHEIKIDEQYTN